MTDIEEVLAGRRPRHQIVVALVFFCTAYTAMCAANDPVHAFLGWELKSTTYRYLLPLWLVLANWIWARFSRLLD